MDFIGFRSIFMVDLKVSRPRTLGWELFGGCRHVDCHVVGIGITEERLLYKKRAAMALERCFGRLN